MNEGSLSESKPTQGFDSPSKFDRQKWLRHVERLYGPLLRDLTVRLGCDDAQDVLQEFYLRVLRYRPQSENDASVRSFINRILRSVVADHFRRRATQRKVAAAIATFWESPISENLSDSCGNEWLPTLIGALPRGYATLIDRIDINEEPRSAVAATLGITSNNLAVRLTRARSALRTRLLAFHNYCFVHGFVDCCCPKVSTRPVARTRRTFATSMHRSSR